MERGRHELEQYLSHSVARATQEQVCGLLVSSSQVLELQGSVPLLLSIIYQDLRVLQRSLMGSFSHWSFELKPAARGELLQDPGGVRAGPGRRAEVKVL